ncbi:MAG: glycosyltransferase family 9 protein [Succinivibrio sp.]|nr:glycosyltransferase family 9 protein [Succinivibrio sp.]
MHLPSKICILRLTALGDCINAYGLVCALLRAHSELEITWVIDQRFISLFSGRTQPERLNLIGVDFRQGFLKAVLKLRQELRGEAFEVLLNLQTSLKASLCSLAIRAKLRLGYDKYRSREGQCFFVNTKVPSPANPHVLAGFMAFAKACGLGSLNPSWDFTLTKEEQDLYAPKYQNRPMLLISPASAKRAKNWTVDGYTAVARYALEQGFFIVLSGGSSTSELKLCADIASRLPQEQCENLCGKTKLRELLSLVSCATLVLCPDSACAHLASALHIPVIALYAVHDPKRVGTWNYPQLWVSAYQKLAHQELGNRHIPWRYRVKNPKAMQEIHPPEVIAAFDKALQLID